MEHPAPTFELMDEEELKDLFVAMCQGDYTSLQALEHHEAHQFQAYAMSRMGQLWVQLEERTRA